MYNYSLECVNQDLDLYHISFRNHNSLIFSIEMPNVKFVTVSSFINISKSPLLCIIHAVNQSYNNFVLYCSTYSILGDFTRITLPVSHISRMISATNGAYITASNSNWVDNKPRHYIYYFASPYKFHLIQLIVLNTINQNYTFLSEFKYNTQFYAILLENESSNLTIFKNTSPDTENIQFRQMLAMHSLPLSTNVTLENLECLYVTLDSAIIYLFASTNDKINSLSILSIDIIDNKYQLSAIKNGIYYDYYKVMNVFDDTNSSAKWINRNNKVLSIIFNDNITLYYFSNTDINYINTFHRDSLIESISDNQVIYILSTLQLIITNEEFEHISYTIYATNLFCSSHWSLLCNLLLSQASNYSQVFHTDEHFELAISQRFGTFFFFDKKKTNHAVTNFHSIIFILHLLFESYIIHTYSHIHINNLAQLIIQLLYFIPLKEYVKYYFDMFRLEIFDSIQTRIITNWCDSEISYSNVFINHNKFIPAYPPSIISIIEHNISPNKALKYNEWPIFKHSWNAIETENTFHPLEIAKDIIDIHQTFNKSFRTDKWWEKITFKILNLGYTLNWFDSIIHSVSFIIYKAYELCKEGSSIQFDNIFLNCSDKELNLFNQSSAQSSKNMQMGHCKMNEMKYVMWNDSRLDTVVTLLSSENPIHIPIENMKNNNLHNFLYSLSLKVLTYSVGMGAIQLSTSTNVESFITTVKINLSGATNEGIIVTLPNHMLKDEDLVWPYLNAGCASGLKFILHIESNSDINLIINRQWLMNQIQDHEPFNQIASAGVILAAGIMGHLKKLQITDILSLLVNPNISNIVRIPLTSAFLLGLGCSYRGLAENTIFKCITVHIQSLSEANEDLELSIETQMAALIAVGLLYEKTCNNFIVNVMITEISRMPSDEHYLNRPGYALAAGICMGLVLLGKGESHGLGKWVNEKLLNLINAGHRAEQPGYYEKNPENVEYVKNNSDQSFFEKALLSLKSKINYPICGKVWEGSRYNPVVTSPAAIVALGFTYLKTNNIYIARDIALPRSLTNLRSIEPNIALLRVFFSELIYWNINIKNADSKNWSYYDPIPQVLVEHVHSSSENIIEEHCISYFYFSLLCASIGGYVLSLGIKFVGTFNSDLKYKLLSELNDLMAYYISQFDIKISGLHRKNQLYINCMTHYATALSLIMCGTGDQDCFSIFQKMHQMQSFNYGNHMCISQAIGFLFLSNGCSIFKTDIQSLSSLILSIFPIWPTEPAESTFYLQPLRHLYASSSFENVLSTYDALSNLAVKTHGSIELFTGATDSNLFYNESRDSCKMISFVTPILLPIHSIIKNIEIRNMDYYSIFLKNTDQFSNMKIKLHKRDINCSLYNSKSLLTEIENMLDYLQSTSHSFEVYRFLNLQLLIKIKSVYYEEYAQYGIVNPTEYSSLYALKTKLDEIFKNGLKQINLKLNNCSVNEDNSILKTILSNTSIKYRVKRHIDNFNINIQIDESKYSIFILFIFIWYSIFDRYQININIPNIKVLMDSIQYQESIELKIMNLTKIEPNILEIITSKLV